MELNDEENRFLERRDRFVRSWRYVGSGLLAMVASLWAWMYFANPLLANPSVVLERLRARSIGQSTIESMAAMLPVSVLAIMFMFMVLAFILIAFAVIANESKYIGMLSRKSRKDGETPNP